jgi:hypothetical protein
MIEQSRRDDLEALGYVLMYFQRGSLPWQGLKANNKRQKYEKISDRKIGTSIEELCRGYPGKCCTSATFLFFYSEFLRIVAEFAKYLEYCRSIDFDGKPEYVYLRQMLRALFHRNGYTYDYVFDWNSKSNVRNILFVFK